MSGERRTKALTSCERILERAGVPRSETGAAVAEIWQALIGHGARITWPPDDPDADPTHLPTPGDHRAALAALRAEVRPTTPATDPDQLLATPPWRTGPDSPSDR